MSQNDDDDDVLVMPVRRRQMNEAIPTMIATSTPYPIYNIGENNRILLERMSQNANARRPDNNPEQLVRTRTYNEDEDLRLREEQSRLSAERTANRTREPQRQRSRGGKRKTNTKRRVSKKRRMSRRR